MTEAREISYAAGPIRILMRDGKLLKEPEIVQPNFRTPEPRRFRKPHGQKTKHAS